MTRVRGLNKIGYEEKGQRTARCTDMYTPNKGIKEVAECSGCKALYWNKRWYRDEDESTRLTKDMVKNEVVCPACQRIQDQNPAGIVVFSGGYLSDHEAEIRNLVNNIEEKALAKNPLARIMEIRKNGEELVVLTTDDKLAQKLGRDIYKAHSGRLEYQWSHEDKFVRVNWYR